MATVQKRGDSYRIIVSCGYDSHGKQIRRSTTWTPSPGMTKKQAEKELERAKVLFEEQCKNGASGGNIKFEAFAKQWFQEYAEHTLRPKTIERYKQFKERTYQAIGHLRLDKITPRQIQTFIHSLEADGLNQRTGGKLSPKTIKNNLSFISSIMDYAVSMFMIDSNPCRNVSLPSAKPIERDCYTLEEAQHFLELLEAEPLQWRTFFTLAIFSGFRRSELLGLEWKDIDFKSGVVNIRRTSQYIKERGIYTDATKTKGSQRSLKLPASVIDLLRQHKIEQSKERLKLGDQWVNTDRLFVAWNGYPLNPNTPLNWLNRFFKRTDMRRVNIHSFRHLNASLLITNGVDPRTVSASLGHSQTSTTLNIYAHTFAVAQAQASEAIANALNFNQKKA